MPYEWADPKNDKGLATPAAQDLLDLYCYVVCLGPPHFSPDLRKHVQSSSEALDALERLLDPSHRHEVSREIGRLLAKRFSRLDGLNHLYIFIPRIIEMDLKFGFAVAKSFVSSCPPSITKDVADTLLSLLAAKTRRPQGNGESNIKQIRYILSLMTFLHLDAEERTRLYLALTQLLEGHDAFLEVIADSLFPSSPKEALSVFLQGRDCTLRFFLAQIARRPTGKAEFFAACRGLTDLGLHTGLSVLARVYKILNQAEGPQRALAPIVRATLLLSIEATLAKGSRLSLLLPNPCDLAAAYLLALVAPGIPEPHRSELCDFLLDQAGHAFRSLSISTSDVEPFTEVVTAAAILHQDQGKAQKEVIRLILEAAGALHVRLQNRRHEDPDAPLTAFRKVLSRLFYEFRGRPAFSLCLSKVIGALGDLAPPDIRDTVQRKDLPDILPDLPGHQDPVTSLLASHAR